MYICIVQQKQFKQLKIMKTPETTPAIQSTANTAKATPVLEMKDKKIVNSPVIADHIVKLLNLGFYVKNNEQKGTLSANRYGKKGQTHVEMMAANVIITVKGEAPIVTDYSNYERFVQSQIVGDPTVK